MRYTLRFLLALIVGLGVLTWAASRLVDQTTRVWSEKDLALRAELAVSGAQPSLASFWEKNDRSAIRRVLAVLARDERILSAEACSADLTLIARTGSIPPELSCAALGPNVRPAADAPVSSWVPWTSVFRLPGGSVHVSALPLLDDSGRPLGFVVLVHDMSFIDRREALTRRFMFVAFAVFSLLASIVTVLAARFSWKGWTNEIRRFLRGSTLQRPEFQPVLRDVRELIQRIAAERQTDGEQGPWNAHRLRQTLHGHLHGEKIVILANREPYIHDRAPDGIVTVRHPASGLVTALEPVMRACSGVWVAHGSGTADAAAADAHGRLRVPPGEESYILRRVWLTPEEEQGYYYGFANEGLWPLCHLAHARPIFRTEDWKYYQQVNRKFVDAVCEEVDTADPVILVQDYHFALAPRLLRDRLPKATILTFWHIPWPNAERLGICPWREEILQGMLGGSILGFHTQYHCNNFLDSVDRFLEARIDREQFTVTHQRWTSLVRAYPISIEWPNHWLDGLPGAEECRAEVFARLGLAPDALLGLGVDRLDYTKGIEERLLTVERALERAPELRGRLTFVELAAPSRTAIERYRLLGESVRRISTRINERFAQGSYRPVVLLHEHHEPPSIFRFYRAADFCYVSSLHDGMNLVAKEFVAARDDERGVLVLSSFTGAARELTEALIVNPYDLDEASAALAAALKMSPEEQRDRMRAMRSLLSEFNVYRWAGRMLVDASRLRRQEALAGRWTLSAAQAPTLM